MPKSKGKKRETPKKARQLTKEDYEELVRKADFVTSSLYPIRYKARLLREDIGEGEDFLETVKKDIQEYSQEVGSRINERLEKVRVYREGIDRKIRDMEASTRMRLKEIEREKEEMDKLRTEAEGNSELLRVRLTEFDQFLLIEKNQKEKIVQLKDTLEKVRTEHESDLQTLKAEFTRDLRKMRSDYEEKINLTDEYARKWIKPCITEMMKHIKLSNTNLAHSMRRISQKQGILFENMSKIRKETNGLRYQLESWKRIQQRKLAMCDPQLFLTNVYTHSRDVYKDVESVSMEDEEREEIAPAKLTPYQELKRTLRLLLRPDDDSTDSREGEDEAEGGGETDSDEDNDYRKDSGARGAKNVKAKTNEKKIK